MTRIVWVLEVATSKHLFRDQRNEKFGLPDEAENLLHQMMLHTKEGFCAKQLLRRLPSTWILSIRGRVVLLSRPIYKFPQANSRRSRTSSPGLPRHALTSWGSSPMSRLQRCELDQTVLAPRSGPPVRGG